MIDDEYNPVPAPEQNPYAADLVTESNSDGEVTKARIWPALVVPWIGIVASVIVSSAALVAGIFAIGVDLDVGDMDGVLDKLFDHPLGIWIAILPGQLGFLSVAVVAAILSPVKTSSRLRLGKGRLPVWTWLVFLVATPSVGFAVSLLFQWLEIEASSQLEMIEKLMVASTGLAFVVRMFLVAVVPGFVEEVLFRGYMQSRLLMRWAPWAAILLSSFVFAVAHLDPVHVCAVFPIGIWLGVVAYRCDSIWPPILCHFGNNLLSLILNQLGFDTLGFGVVELSICIPSVLALVWSLVLICRSGSPTASLDRS